jgi:Fe-S cluster biogenesis protein NfuA
MDGVEHPKASTAALEDALRPAREALQLDGADLELCGERDGVVHVRLEVKDAACAECVLPRHMLEAVLLTALQRELSHVAAVRVDDPRVPGEA